MMAMEQQGDANNWYKWQWQQQQMQELYPRNNLS